MSFRLKTIIGVGIIEAILLFILIGSSLRFLKNSTEEQLQKRAQTTAQLFATTTKDAVLSSDLASLESFVKEVLSNAGLEYAKVLDGNQVLAEAGNKDSLTKVFKEDIDYKLIEDGIFDTYANIVEEGEVYGRVEIGISISSLKATYDKAKRQTLIIAGVELLLSALFSLILGSFLTKRLGKLKEATKIVSDGNYEHKIHIDGSDELSEVSHSFNKMVSNLNTSKIAENEAREQLNNLNEKLEETVKIRTESLEEAMVLLQKEKEKQLELAYNSGVAENAINVLHNIGNAITPVVAQTSSLRDSREIGSVGVFLDKIKEMLSEQLEKGTVSEFLKSDAKGSQIIPVLEELATNLREIENEQKNAVLNIEENLNNITEIISAQEKHANVKVEDVSYEASSVIKEIIALEKDVTTNNNIILSFENSDELGPMSGNKNKLMKVVLNLVKNAIESIGQQRKLENDLDYQGKIEIHLKKYTEDFYSVLVKDNGAGADEGVLDNAFNLGFSTKKHKSDFGLHNSANFIVANGGEITLTSPGKGQGAEAFFTFPMEMKSI